MNEKISPVLDISVDVECPHCEHFFDLFDCYELKDDGWLYDLLMPKDSHWSDACKDFSKEHLDTFGEPFLCPKCDKEIDIGWVQW